MDDAELARLEAKMKNPNAWGYDPRYVERLAAEVESLRTIKTAARELVESDTPSWFGPAIDKLRVALGDNLDT